MMRTRTCRFRRNRGFTLIELVVVMVIIGILAGAVTLQIMRRTEDARVVRARQDIATIEQAVELYGADNGAPPTTQQGLAALRSRPTAPPTPRNWSGPYLKKAPIDPWGGEYVYRYPGQINPEGYDIISYGDGGKPGGDGYAADLTNSDEE